MAYIQPNSIVQFYSDLGLDSSYENTLYFASVAAKDAYFDGVTRIAQASPMTYSRAERGFIRVELPMSTLISAGYMRFKNTSFENKWFYAFVKNVEYINNNVTQVNFELDVMMTWMGAFTLSDCFIERQHTLRDGIGNNIADEGLETGEYITESVSKSELFAPYVYAVFSAVDVNGTTVTNNEGGEYTGIYSGLKMETFGSIQGVNDYLANVTGADKSDAIGCILMLPTMAQDARNAHDDDPTASNRPLNYNYSVTKPYTTIAGYTPRNKKLFCYPYKCLTVYNSEGDSVDYMYEYFNTLPDDSSSGTCDFTIFAVMTAQPVVTLIPNHYKGEQPNYSEQLCMNDWASCAFNIDGWKAYWAQNKSSIKTTLSGMAIATASDLGSGIVNTGMHLAGAYLTESFGMLMGAGFSGQASSNRLVNNLVNINSALGKLNDKKRLPNIIHGSQVTDYMTAGRVKDFYFIRKSITKNYAMMIDSYFDMYGYAVKQHGVPNMNARPNWTYVKTVGCVIHGNLPADDGAKIEQIFDKGTRFWKNHNNIGDYSLNNAATQV